MITFFKKLQNVSALTLFISSIVVIITDNEEYARYHGWKLLEINQNVFYFIFFISLFALLYQCFRKKISLSKLFLLSVPAEISLFTRVIQVNHIHYSLHLFVGLWIISLGIYLIFKRHKKTPTPLKAASLESSKKKWLPSLFLSLIILLSVAHFSLGFKDLKNEVYTDERLWTYGAENRIEKFWISIREQNWIGARPSDKPGVTLVIISGPGLIWEKPSYFFHNYLHNEHLLQMLFAFRLPVLIFGTLMLPVFYLILKRTCNSKIALLGTIFIGTSPILLGISRVINPDSILYTFMPFTFFSYLTYLKKNNKRWLYATGIFLGLSLLTKYIANILFVFFFASIFIELLFDFKKISQEKVHSFIKEKLLDFATIVFISLSVFYLLFPGVWMKLDRILIATIFSEAFAPIWKYFAITVTVVVLDLVFFKSRAISWIFSRIQKIRKTLLLIIPTVFLLSIAFTLLNTYTNMSFFDFENILSSPKSSVKKFGPEALGIFFSGFYALIFAVSPITLLGSILGIALSIKEIVREKITHNTIVIWNSALFIIVYYLASTVSLVGPTIRYQIVLYPIFFAISGIGIWIIIKKMFFQTKQYAIIFFTLSAIIAGGQIFVLWKIAPFFSSYNNLLLPQEYTVNPKDMGDGNYKVAEFLNSLPNAKNLSIWSDNNGICTLFVGNCSITTRNTDFLNKNDYDYYVVSRRRESKVVRPIKEMLAKKKSPALRLDRLYESSNSVFELSLGGRASNFIRVIPKGIKVYEPKQSVPNPNPIQDDSCR